MARYALIGKTLAHSQSQALHRLIGNTEYDMLEIPDESGLQQTLDNTAYDGFNVTIPYKEAVIKYLDEISERARAANAVNVIKRTEDGRLIGYNTDIGGFMHMVGNRANGRKCLVLGTGGAARGVAVGLELLGAKSVILVSRNPEQAATKLGKEFRIIGYDKLENYYDSQVVVNATPVGTIPHNEQSPIKLAGHSMTIFDHLELAVDLIYNPYRTKFLQDARRLTGCKTMSGLEMLIYQAIEARNIWNGRKSSVLSDKLNEGIIKKEILKNQLNIVAVGMPGSGKTTIFRKYANEMGKPFIDIDKRTEELMGETIEEVLAPGGKGEEYFREKECEAIQEASGHTGTVIATGGGSVLNPINRDLLRSNGLVVYIKRPTGDLSIKGRPISQKIGVTELFNSRSRIYRKMADITIQNTKTFGGRKASTGEGDSYFYEMKKFVYAMSRKIERYIGEISRNKWT